MDAPQMLVGTLKVRIPRGADLEGLVTQGDSNVVGMPLSMLLRNAGVAAMTSCHRISYKEVLMDSRADSRAEARAEADACGPALPGISGRVLLPTYAMCCDVSCQRAFQLASQPAWNPHPDTRTH